MQHDTTWGVPEEEVQLYCKVLEIKELSFESLRNAFRKACLRHHPKMIEYHLMQYEKRSRFVDVYYSNFHRAVVAYGTLAAMLVVQGACFICNVIYEEFTIYGRNECVASEGSTCA